jgi:hypothetical protein
MGRAGRVDPDASHRWSARNRLSRPVGPIQTRADAMRRPAGDSLTTMHTSEKMLAVACTAAAPRNTMAGPVP